MQLDVASRPSLSLPLNTTVRTEHFLIVFYFANLTVGVAGQSPCGIPLSKEIY